MPRLLNVSPRRADPDQGRSRPGLIPSRHGRDVARGVSASGDCFEIPARVLFGIQVITWYNRDGSAWCLADLSSGEREAGKFS